LAKIEIACINITLEAIASFKDACARYQVEVTVGQIARKQITWETVRVIGG
jgi:hypothetical protein